MPGYDPRRDPVVRALLRSEDLEAKRPEHRALILGRLEMLWRACEPHVAGVDANGEPMFPDYRYVDLGARILDRQIRILEVLKPDPPVDDPVEHGRPAAAVKASKDLLELEARMRGGE